MNHQSAESMLAHELVRQDPQAFKVVILEHGGQAGTLFNLLTKVHRISKDQISQLGPTLSGEQMDQVLSAARPIVLVSKDLINHHRCVFRLPAGSNRLIAIQILDGEVSSFPITCEGPTFEFKLGWFSNYR
jgi:hypothetical protein